MSSANDPSNAFQTVLTVATILAVLVVVLSTIVGIGTLAGEFELVDTTGETFQVEEDAEDVTIVDSRGHGLHFGPDGGSVVAAPDGGVGDGNSTLSVWGGLDENAATWDDYHLINVGNGSAGLQYRAGEWYGYYEQDSGEVAVVNATASSPRQLTQVGLVANGTHLELVVNGSTAATDQFAAENYSVPSARGWYGDQDELAVWDAPLNDSQTTTLYDDPVGPVAYGDLTMRLMMDEGEGSSTYVIVDDSNADLEGDVSWTSGLEGQELVEGEDYVLHDDGTVEILSGSRLDALYVAWVEYGLGGTWGEVTDMMGSAILLGALVPIVLIALVVLRLIGSTGRNNNGGRI